VSPSDILASKPLADYLLGRKTIRRQEGLTTDQRIIDHAADPILCIDPAGVIEEINPSVTGSLGYPAEELLGQRITSIFVDAQAEKLAQQMKLMGGRQSAPLYEDHFTVLNGAEQPIPCWLSVLAIFHDDDLSSFVVILTDESILLRQQEEAEKAKKDSETLLYQILPRGIVLRLNSGERDISFTIPSATLMFIDIVKFSDFASNLTPHEIMGNLSMIFYAFDEACATHDLLTKIKLIGNVYMCAGGLFSPDADPATHAEQMIRFGLEALGAIEDVNVKLCALLAVRIGANTGGPIIAGVLGTDKPTFDIIGDPINVAARLQSTDVPGRIQISEDTFALIRSLGFQTEYRGEVELKGKGKKKTYLVFQAIEPSLTMRSVPSGLDALFTPT
jgi:PAS domain S-box-containing protein